MKCECRDIKVEDLGITWARISLVIPKVYLKELNGLLDKALELVIRKKRKKRTLNANAYCWVLCDKIARTLADGSTKEDIYRRAIENVGTFEPCLVRLEKLQEITERWSAGGVGWIVKDTHVDISGMRQIFIYYGSSTYTTEEMARLIDWLINDAEQIGCTDILTPVERSLMLEEWKHEKEYQADGSRDEGTPAAGT